MKMNYNNINENTIYVANFFDDIENELILYSDKKSTLYISSQAKSYIELLKNLTDINCSTDDLIGKSFQERYFQTIRSWFEKLNNEVVIEYLRVI